MAYTDPQTITINAIAIPLARVITGTEKGLFQSSDGNTRIEVTPSPSRTRRQNTARLYQQKTTADPLVGSVNIRVGDNIALSINRPNEGYSDAEILLQVKGFLTWLTAGTDENLKKLIAGEN